MKLYNKEIIHKYAINMYVKITFEDGSEKEGFLVYNKNNNRLYELISMTNLFQVVAYSFYRSSIRKITLINNGYEIPKTKI